MNKYVYYLASIFTLLGGIRNWPRVIAVFLGIGAHPGNNQRIHLRNPALSISVRGKMDVWSVKEALLDRLYERYGFVVQDGWTVVDIGAGIGEFTLSAAAGMPSNRVLAFEPFPDSYRLLEENLRQNGIANVEAFAEAVWSRTGRLRLNLSGGEPLQLTSQVDEFQAEQISGSLVVDCCSLVDKLEGIGIRQVDLLKLDCEGAEYEILFNLPPVYFPRIRRIVLEYHDNVTAYTHLDLAAFLKEQGYRVKVTPNVVHNYLGYLSAERNK